MFDKDDLQPDLLPRDEFAAALLAEQQSSKKARAHLTRSRIATRRAKSEATLAEILPPLAPGDCVHVLSHGDVDAMSYARHYGSARALDYMLLSTWCMAMDDVLALRDWLQSGHLRRLDCYVGEIFPGTYADEHAALADAVRPYGGRVCVFRNHCKLFALRAADQSAHLVIETSANINTNPRCEHAVVTHDRDLFAFTKAFFDDVKSFARDFDAWVPAP